MIKKIFIVLSISLLAFSSSNLDVYANNKYKEEFIKGSNEEISMKLNKSVFKESKNAILVNEDAIIDSISATTLAYLENAPIITTEWKHIDKDTIDYIKELGVKNITIVGGLKAVSRTSENKLKDMGLEVRRIHGKDRFDTSLKIAKEIDKIKPFKEVVLLNESVDIKNAIGIYSYAAKNNMPVMWASDINISKIVNYLDYKKPDKVYAIGNSENFKENVANKVDNVEFIEEMKRSTSNIDMINKFYKSDNMNKIYLLNGEFERYFNETQYISLGVVAAKQNIPILIAEEDLTRKQEDFLQKNKVKEIIEVGHEVGDYDLMKIITSKNFISTVALILLLVIIGIRVLL